MEFLSQHGRIGHIKCDRRNDSSSSAKSWLYPQIARVMTDGYKFFGGVWTAANIEDSSIKPQGQKLVFRQKIVINLSAGKDAVFLQGQVERLQKECC